MMRIKKLVYWVTACILGILWGVLSLTIATLVARGSDDGKFTFVGKVLYFPAYLTDLIIKTTSFINPIVLLFPILIGMLSMLAIAYILKIFIRHKKRGGSILLFITLIFFSLMNVGFVSAEKTGTLVLNFIDYRDYQLYTISTEPQTFDLESRFRALNIRITDFNENEVVFRENITKSDNLSFSLEPGRYKLYINSLSSSATEFNNNSYGYMVTEDSEVIIPLYANTLYKDVFADAPWRIEPDITYIPLLLEVKDADVCDYDIGYVYIYEDVDHDDVNNDPDDILRFQYWLGITISKTQNNNLYYPGDWYTVLFLNKNVFQTNPADIHIKFQHNDPYDDCFDGDTHDNLKVLLDTEYLPKFDNWYCGDTHYHSYYTDNAVESGAPVEAVYWAGKAIGLNWITITDHSFDLDSKNERGKWPRLKSDCNYYSTSDFICLVGEEVSVVNSEGKFVHFLAYEIDDYIKGEDADGRFPINEVNADINGDGIDDTAVTYDFEDVVNYLNTIGGFGYLAHPVSHPKFDLKSVISEWILNRGDYTQDDYDVMGYSGLQLWNEIIENQEDFDRLEAGLDIWKELLLEGRKLFIEGGSDAHGDLNYRRWGVDVYYETGNNAIGKVQTCCYATLLTKSNIFSSMKNGHCYMTNNGALKFEINGEYDNNAMVGETLNVCSLEDLTIKIDYNLINGCNLTVNKGNILGTDEVTIYHNWDLGSGTRYTSDYENKNSYYRVECVDEDKRVYTNPIWINVHSENFDGDSVCDFYDCDPEDPSIYPDAPEICDGNDNNCDGDIPANENDNDEDNYMICQGDCNDNDETIYPGAPELCDDKDNDCDGLTDEDCPAVITIYSPLNKSYNNTRVLINVSTDKKVKYIYRALNSNRFSRLCRDCDSFSDTYSMGEGSNALTIKAVDYEGNEITETVYFFVDSMEPTIRRIYPRDEEYVKGLATFMVQYSEDNLESIVLHYGASPIEEYTLVDCPSGRNQECSATVDISHYDSKDVGYYFVISDTVNSATSDTYKIFVDGTPPIVTINSPASVYGSRRILLDVSVSEKVESLELSTDGERFRRLCRDCDSYEREYSFDEGFNTLEIKAIDKAGNEGYASVEFIVDEREPRITRIEPRDGSYVKGSNFTVYYDEDSVNNVTLFYGTEGSMNEHFMDYCPSGRRQECIGTVDLTSFNNQTIQYYFVVNSFLHNDSSKTYSVTVDSTVPTVTMNSPKNDTYYSRSVRLNISASEEVELELSDNGGRFSRLCSRCGSYDRSRSFSYGTHNLLVRATDKSGNEGYSSIVFTIERT